MKKRRELLRALSRLTQLGPRMAVCVLLGGCGGICLDRRLGTSPWLLLTGALVGMLAAFKVFYDLTIKQWKDTGKDQAE